MTTAESLPPPSVGYYSRIPSRKTGEASKKEKGKERSNLARSAGVFRAAVRKWLADALPDVADETDRYRVFLADLAKDAASAFRPAVADALKAYAPVRRKFVAARKKREEARPPELFALRRSYSYADDYEEYAPASLSAVQPFLLPKEYSGRANETAFVAYLEQRADKVAWWFKNGSEGADSFGLKYWNTAERRTRLFYPDWIVKFWNGLRLRARCARRALAAARRADGVRASSLPRSTRHSRRRGDFMV